MRILIIYIRVVVLNLIESKLISVSWDSLINRERPQIDILMCANLLQVNILNTVKQEMCAFVILYRARLSNTIATYKANCIIHISDYCLEVLFKTCYSMHKTTINASTNLSKNYREMRWRKLSHQKLTITEFVICNTLHIYAH